MVKTRVTDKSAPVLAGLTRLASLNLDYTAVTDKGVETLRALPALRELRLDSATITDASAPVFTAMPGLKFLGIYHTLVTERAHGEIRSALPGCKILWERESSLPNRRGS